MAHRLAFGLAALVLLASHPSSASTLPSDLCPPAHDPCIVTGTRMLGTDEDIDFGDRTLLFERVKMYWTGNLTLRARRIELSLGDKIIERATTPTSAGMLTLMCDSADIRGDILNVGSGVLMEDFDGVANAVNPGSTFTGKIQVKDDQQSFIGINSFGPITFGAKVKTKAKGPTPYPAQFVVVSTVGDVTVTDKAQIKLRRAVADPATELVWLEAPSGTLTVDGLVDARATAGAWAFDFEADGDVGFGPKSKVIATGKNGHAQVGINSQSGSVALHGRVLASSNAQITDPNGIGVCAAGDITVDAAAQLVEKSGSGGVLVLGAGGQVTVGTAVKGAKVQLNKDSGDVEICGDGGVTIAAASSLVPAPAALGSGCLSATSPTQFDLDCNH